MRRLLVVEDDAAIRDGIVELLRRNGYAAAAVTDFADVAAQVLDAAPDLLLLDLNLPGVDGGFVCREVRAKSQVPIIAVTSRDTDMDELVTLSAGADDFVTKPYNDQVLLVRIASLLKRSYGEGAAASARISVRGVTLDTARCEVTHDGRTAELHQERAADPRAAHALGGPGGEPPAHSGGASGSPTTSWTTTPSPST